MGRIGKIVESAFLVGVVSSMGCTVIRSSSLREMQWEAIEAVRACDRDRLEVLLKNGVDPNARLGQAYGLSEGDMRRGGISSWTLAMLVVNDPHPSPKGLEVLEALVAGGADADITNAAGDSAVDLAFRWYSATRSTVHEELAAFLAGESNKLSRAVHIAPCVVGPEPAPAFTTILHLSVRSPRLVETLCARGVKVNAVDELGGTPLHEAVKARNLKSVRLLLAYGADPRARDVYQRKPEYWIRNDWGLDRVFNESEDGKKRQEGEAKREKLNRSAPRPSDEDVRIQELLLEYEVKQGK